MGSDPIDYALQSLRPGHGRAPFDGCLILRFISYRAFVALAPLGWGHLHTMLAIGGRTRRGNG